MRTKTQIRTNKRAGHTLTCCVLCVDCVHCRSVFGSPAKKIQGNEKHPPTLLFFLDNKRQIIISSISQSEQNGKVTFSSGPVLCSEVSSSQAMGRLRFPSGGPAVALQPVKTAINTENVSNRRPGLDGSQSPQGSDKRSCW